MGGEKEKVQVRGGAGRCPYCHDLVSDPTTLVACAVCGARHHEQCHAEHGACSACSSTEVLVPRNRAKDEVSERPPRGSKIQVEERTDDVVIGFENAMTQQLILFCVLSALMIITAPLILVVLWFWFRKRHARHEVILHENGLAITTDGPFQKRKKVVARREEVGAIRLDRVQQGGILRLTVDVGVDRIQIATGHQHGSVAPLKEPEVEWLYQRLLAWKEQG